GAAVSGVELRMGHVDARGADVRVRAVAPMARVRSLARRPRASRRTVMIRVVETRVLEHVAGLLGAGTRQQELPQPRGWWSSGPRGVGHQSVSSSGYRLTVSGRWVDACT